MKPSCNKFKIPFYLKPLPLINLNSNRNMKNNEPKPLVIIASLALDTQFDQIYVNSQWNDFIDIFGDSSRIVSDSFKRLCHIDQPASATAYVLKRAAENKMNMEAYFKLMKIVIDDEKQCSHWEKSTKPSLFPRIIIGRWSVN